MVAGVLNAALSAALDELSAFAKTSTQSLDPRAVLLTHPPAHRQRAADDLSSTITRLETLSFICRSARQKLDDILAQVERSKHDCQLALSPVSSLPREILSMIFELVSLTFPSSELTSLPLSSIAPVAQVCSTWRMIAHSSSSFWTNLYVHRHMPASLFDRTLEISKDKPIRVIVRDRKVADFPFNVKGVSPRWREKVEAMFWTSRVDPRDHMDSLGSYPALETLCITPRPTRRREWAYGVGDIFEHVKFPKLQRLALGSVDATEIPRIKAPALMSLHLLNVTIDPASFDQVLGDLVTLQELGLNCIKGFEADTDDMTFLLPYLRSLTTENLTIESRRHFLNPARYPALRHWVYYDHRLVRIEPEVPDLLHNFVRGVHDLEGMSASCSLHQHLGIFEALTSPAIAEAGVDALSSPAIEPSFTLSAPCLRTLSIGIPQRSNHEESHKPQEAGLCARVERVLKYRAAEGCPTLTELVVRLCPPFDWRVFGLQGLVIKLVPKPCERRSRVAGASDSEWESDSSRESASTDDGMSDSSDE